MGKIICLTIGYLFGCILTAEIVAKANNIDVREIDPESPHRGNPGMANIMLNVGFKQGLIVLFGDSLKAILAMLICYLIFRNNYYIYGGFGCILGHNFPFYRKFNGGKGVLVTIIWFIAIMPKYFWITLLVAAIVVAISGKLNLGAVTFPIVAVPIAYKYLGIETTILVVISAILMVIRNYKDLVCIFKGKYNRVDLRKIK